MIVCLSQQCSVCVYVSLCGWMDGLLGPVKMCEMARFYTREYG